MLSPRCGSMEALVKVSRRRRPASIVAVWRRSIDWTITCAFVPIRRILALNGDSRRPATRPWPLWSRISQPRCAEPKNPPRCLRDVPTERCSSGTTSVDSGAWRSRESPIRASCVDESWPSSGRPNSSRRARSASAPSWAAPAWMGATRRRRWATRNPNLTTTRMSAAFSTLAPRRRHLTIAALASGMSRPSGGGDPYSITRSARARNASGIVTPRWRAVRRFTISSNWVGCSTGMSAGRVPLKIRSTIAAARTGAWPRRGP